MYMCMHVCVHTDMHEGDLQELVPSFHQVGPRDGRQVVRLVSKHLHLLDHLFGL